MWCCPATVTGASGEVYGAALGLAWWVVMAAVLMANHGHLTRQLRVGESAREGLQPVAA